MSGRTLDEFNDERQALDGAHAQNEAGRDAFIALAHTALFAASVSFVGDVAPIPVAIWKPALLFGWTADVVGLLALTFSFGAARRAIDARRKALNEPEPPTDQIAERLNAIALWSFPIALLCLFSFVTANVVNNNDREGRSSNTAQLSGKGSDAPAACASPRAIGATVRSDPSAASTGAAAPATPAIPEKVTNDGAGSRKP